MSFLELASTTLGCPKTWLQRVLSPFQASMEEPYATVEAVARAGGV